jgi:ribonuclease HII
VSVKSIFGYTEIMNSIIHIVGIDEVGRGPLAGPVTLCACKVAHDFDFEQFKGIKDSKKLSAKKREEWFLKISELKSLGKVDFAYSFISAKEIDEIGIAPAIKKALANCLHSLKLSHTSTQILLDGSLYAPKEFLIQETIIKGDEKVPLISAASIVAKVMRDRYMDEQGKLYPEYGFEKHKGYGTSAHIKAIKKLGITPIHRKSFLKNIV